MSATTATIKSFEFIADYVRFYSEMSAGKIESYTIQLEIKSIGS